jgi:dipeptidyl aminopeptidase/acylaminoacyl peptidase
MPEIVADLRRAVRFIRFHANEYGIDGERLGLWGGSAGGHLSLLLGTTADIGIPDAAEEFERSPGRVAAVVAYFPLSDLQRFVETIPPDVLKQYPVLSLRAEQYREFSPLYFVSSDAPPTLIVHGDQDKEVSIIEGESMHRALLKSGAISKFVTIEGAGHGFYDEDADHAMEETVDWFKEHLGAK